VVAALCTRWAHLCSISWRTWCGAGLGVQKLAVEAHNGRVEWREIVVTYVSRNRESVKMGALAVSFEAFGLPASSPGDFPRATSAESSSTRVPRDSFARYNLSLCNNLHIQHSQMY